jgi:hypothetical protein
LIAVYADDILGKWQLSIFGHGAPFPYEKHNTLPQGWGVPNPMT